MTKIRWTTLIYSLSFVIALILFFVAPQSLLWKVIKTSLFIIALIFALITTHLKQKQQN
ncbi:hypothetical protein FHQ08_01000 [Lactobacillus sp. CC-MHH1034]|uniref:hypothetical protein n=1 Tax=Agrilactobacillus fermenti TaxID=2586909 RepID=UPI001E433EE3|nr:hypothetical protein [Agrilactobacillus fermenti]MCD2255286.1 hypothetical protein [Agrilactobacillus fermenti]